MTSLNPKLGESAEKETTVVYGVYDSSSQPFMVRMNDLFIDRQKVKVEEKSYFFHLLAVMLDAGIPVMRALRILAKKTTHERFARIINTIAYDVERGKRASQSMTKFPDVFKASEVGVVRSGEAIGNLGKLLFRLAEQTQRSHELFLKVRGAMIYPIAVMIALFVSGGIVVTVVIPKLDQFFTQSNFEMPTLTLLVLKVGRFFVEFSWLVLIGIVLVGLMMSFYANTQNGRRRVDGWLLGVPWLKHVIRKYNVAQFVQVMSLLVDAGVPIHDAIKITEGALSNTLYKDYMRVLKHDVERGEKIANSLTKAPYLFPETVVAMISVGENTGQLGLISDKLAKHYEREVQYSLDNFTTILEPVVIVIVGLAVGVLAVALLAPIFSLSTLVA